LINIYSDKVAVCHSGSTKALVYRVIQKKYPNMKSAISQIPQHKNRSISEMTGNFYGILLIHLGQNCVSLHVVLRQNDAKLTSRMNFATEQKDCFIKVTPMVTINFVGTSLWHNILFMCKTK